GRHALTVGYHCLASLTLVLCAFFFPCAASLPLLHPFPTRRSSDLYPEPLPQLQGVSTPGSAEASYYTWVDQFGALGLGTNLPIEDRKSTRLNSSHVSTSYAVFCLKKKTSPHSTTRSSYARTASPAT